MQRSDTSRRRKVKIEYLSEDLVPEPGKPEPVVGSIESIKVTKWYINRVLGFLAGSTIACLGVAAAVPNPAVQGTAAAICAGSFGLARFLLAKVCRPAGKVRQSHK